LPAHIYKELEYHFTSGRLGLEGAASSSHASTSSTSSSTSSSSSSSSSAVDSSNAQTTSSPLKKKITELPLPLRETENNPALIVDKLGQKLSLDDLDWEGQRVLMRVDYNVPLRDGVVTDESRVTGTLSSIKHILGRKGKQGGCKCIVLITHLGRPGGDFQREKYSLKYVVPVLKVGRPLVSPVSFQIKWHTSPCC
jgi:hypothetical protein